MSIKKFFVLVMLFVHPLQAFAAKYHWKFSIEMKDQSLNDEETKIKVGDWSCTVGQAKQDKYESEMRRIGCGIGDGLQAYLLTVCYKDKKTGKARSDSGTFNLQQSKSGSITVSLYCE